MSQRADGSLRGTLPTGGSSGQVRNIANCFLPKTIILLDTGGLKEDLRL